MRTVYILRRIEKDGYSYLCNDLNFIKQNFNNFASTFKVENLKEFISEQEAEDFLRKHTAKLGVVEIIKVYCR